MKTNLLRIGLRLSLMVIAFSCGTHLALGQGSEKIMHKVYTCVYGNATINCPEEIGDGEDFTFTSTLPEARHHLTFNITQDGKMRSVEFGNSDDGIIKNVKGTILINAVEGGYPYVQGRERYTCYVDHILPAIFKGFTDNVSVSHVTMRNFLKVNNRVQRIWYPSFNSSHYANVTSVNLPPYHTFGSTDDLLSGCDKLQEVHLLNGSSSGYQNIEKGFGNKDLSNVTLYVPEGSKAEFSNSKFFGRFKEIKEEKMSNDKHAVFVKGDYVTCEAPDSVVHGKTISLKWTCPAGIKPSSFTVYMGGKYLDIKAEALDEITIPNVTGDVLVQVSTYQEYEDEIFKYEISQAATKITLVKRNLAEVEIPKIISTSPVRNHWVSGIDNEAFKDQINLKKITIKGLTDLYGSVFEGCTALKEIHCESAEPGKIYMRTPYDDAFKGVDKDACVLFVPAGASAAYKAAYGWNKFKNIREEGTYSITRTGFEEVAFYGPDFVADGERLEARLTPESGYVLGVGDITVTMGGKKLDPMSKEFFYGTFGKDTLTIETVSGDVVITAKARKIDGDPFVAGDLTYRITGEGTVEVAGVKEDSYTRGRSYIIPSSIDAEGNYYHVTGIGDKAFNNRIMESITIPSSVERIGTETFLDAQAEEIHIQGITPPATVNGSFNILDKNKCKIYVPKGALSAYHSSSWDWLGFPYIMEEGDKYFDVSFELSGLTVKPFQPEIAISGRSLSFTLVPDSGNILPDSIEVRYTTGPVPYGYDAKTGKVTIDTVNETLTIKALAIGALSPDENTDIVIGKDSTYSDGNTTGGKFNGVIGNDEESTRIKSLKIDTEEGKVTGITLKSLTVAPGSSMPHGVTITEASEIEITLDGDNDLGKVLNQGITRLQSGLNALLNAEVENKGIFADETGLLNAVTGPANLTISRRPEKAPKIEIGSSTLLKIEASTEGEAILSYIWQRFDNNEHLWEQVKPETQQRNALSFLRSDATSTNDKAQLEVAEAGKYRCLVSSKAGTVTSTLTTYSEVSIVSSTPEPAVTYSVTLPSVEGATLDPSAGAYPVEEGDSFSFSLTLNADYDQSTPIIKVGDKVIEPTSAGKYEIKDITSDITISITGIVKNITVGNAEVESGTLKIWGSNGVLHIRSAYASTAYIVTFDGQLYKAITLPVGETMITVSQGSYIIRIGDQSYKIRL